MLFSMFDLFDEISSLINRAASYVDTDEYKLCKTPEQIENFVTPYLKNDKVFIDLKIAINLSENCTIVMYGGVKFSY